MKNILLAFYGILMVCDCLSQSASNPIQFPKMTPPSPEAASLGRYGEFPVTLATGTPEISIPLYEINSGKLKLPLGISYHASGIRVNDVASRVGLGWSLQAGGVISRVVKGLPDDEQFGYYVVGMPPPSQQDSLFLCFQNYQALMGSRDGEPDIFYYNFPNKSGKFVFTNRQPSGNTPIAVTIPYDLIKINFSLANSIKITDADGTLYVFGTSLSGKSAYEVTTSMSPNGATYPGATSFTTAWYLTEIVSADKSDTIKLTYTDPYYVPGEYHVSTTLKDNISDPATSNPHFFSYSIGSNWNDVNQIRLKEIYFRNGKVSFEYSGGGRADVSTDSSLTGLRVYQLYNNVYTQIKRYAFYQSYFNCRNIAPQPAQLSKFPGDPSQRLRLDGLQEIDVNGAGMPGYNFGYVPKQLPNLASYAQDFWGFYNAANNSNLLIYNAPAAGPSANPPSTTYGANRNVNPDSVDAGMLNRITFPTGGYSTFQFECNKLGSTNVGGLRIKKIISYDGLGGGITKTYNYYNPVAISNLYTGDMAALGQFFSVPLQSKEPFSQGSGQVVTRTYTHYLENFSFPLGSSSGAAVCYGQVEELYDSTSGTNGKSVYSYTTDQDASVSIVPQNTVTNEWRRGLLLTERKYKASTPGNYVLLASKQNVYTYNDRPSLMVNSLATRATLIAQYDGIINPYISACPAFVTDNTFQSAYNPMLVGNNYLTQEIDTVFDQNGSNPQIRSINYYYDDSLNIQPIRFETTNSKGDLTRSIRRTPLEKAAINAAMPLSSTASLAIDSLLAKNIIGPVIDQEKYYGPTLTGRIRTNYKLFNANLVAPSDLQVQIGSGPVETRVQYNSYDAYGNVVSGGKVNDAVTTYMWDYQKAFVVAEVANADSSSVAYTSFESDGTGNWSITDTARNRSYGITGIQSYSLVTGKSISKSVPPGRSYIVSYWSQNGPVSVSANSVSVGPSLTGLTKNGWTYYEHLLPNNTNSISITATSALIDELRLHPQDAQMKTYTYNPLVGVSSVCSANNSITYYEYDNFNRLKVIRDMDRNVIKVIDYEYQASPHTFYNNPQSGAFTRNCPSCLMGSSVTYLVPAKKYWSVISQPDADQKAVNEVNANGQHYADSVGTCSTPSTAPITGANGTTKSFTIGFSNTCTGTNYNFTLNVTNGTSIGPVPVGNYNISISPVGGSGTYTYMVNGFVQNTTTANFYNINITSSSNNIIIH